MVFVATLGTSRSERTEEIKEGTLGCDLSTLYSDASYDSSGVSQVVGQLEQGTSPEH